VLFAYRWTGSEAVDEVVVLDAWRVVERCCLPLTGPIAGRGNAGFTLARVRTPEKPAARGWHRHPAVRTGDQLTLGERSADRLRNSMGSWTFVLGALAFLAIWMLYNRGSGFDPFPFILLNLVLSCLAALQGAILLIAAKRSDQIAQELALHDFETDENAAALLKELVADVKQVRAENAALRASNEALHLKIEELRAQR
jgi:uncharacterized membrane protein